MSTTAYQRFVCIRDDFYEDPEKVYRAAKTATYIEHEVATGVRSSTIYHEPGVKRKLERLLGLKITRWDTEPAAENGVFYIGAAQGRLKEKPGIHFEVTRRLPSATPATKGCTSETRPEDRSGMWQCVPARGASSTRPRQPMR